MEEPFEETRSTIVPPRTLSGSYLAGRFAYSQSETAKAAAFYRYALARDPESETLLERTFLIEMSEGQWAEAGPLAERLMTKPEPMPIARILLAVQNIKAGRFVEAEKFLGPVGDAAAMDLTTLLMRSWIKLGAGDAQAALDTLANVKPEDDRYGFVTFHGALVADIAGRRAEARLLHQQIARPPLRTMRSVLAFTRHALHAGDLKLAETILTASLERPLGEPNPFLQALRTDAASGTPTDLLVTSAERGLAEAFFGMGEALVSDSRGNIIMGTIYLQLALHLDPEHPYALQTLGQVYEATRRYNDAYVVYNRIAKDSPLAPSVAIRKGANLAAQDRIEEAKAELEKSSARYPSDIKILGALGEMMRGKKRFAEAATYYSRAIALVEKPDERHWSYFYSRGICHDRLKDWPAAEKDLRKALRLSPDQAQVLNYLGYSWVEQNKNLRQGLQLIEKAVRLQPGEGYIVDSLGWAHYKLGNFKLAVLHLERAVALQPGDPTLNDHFGDALWRVGREREARFQWDQAIILKPEPEELERIKVKLANGLEPLPPAPIAKRTRPASEPEPPPTRKKSARQIPVPNPSPVF